MLTGVKGRLCLPDKEQSGPSGQLSLLGWFPGLPQAFLQGLLGGGPEGVLEESHCLQQGKEVALGAWTV